MHFGTAAPKFKGIYESDYVLLDAALVIEDKPLYDVVEQPAVEGGHINFINKGYWWVYLVRIHVFKYEESIKKAKELMSYLGKDVYLWRHRDGEGFKDKNGDLVPFRITEVTPNYFKTAIYHDRIDIMFKSTEYVDLSQSILPENVLVDRDGRVLTDRDGNYLTSRN